MPKPIHLVVAMRSESRPIVDAYSLEVVAGTAPFHLYRGQGVVLVCAGVGRAAAAAGVGFLHAYEGLPAGRPWLNIGVAGGAFLRPGRPAVLGEAAIASRVIDSASGQISYRPLLFDLPAELATVHTMDRLETSYEPEGLFEMEAAGFVAAASRLSPPELVQVLKVVSDGPDEGIERLTASRIETLIEAQMEVVRTLVEELRSLADQLPPGVPEGLLQTILEGRHFTTTEKRQLERTLHRFAALGAQPLLEPGQCSKGADVLERLTSQLEAFPIHLVARKKRQPPFSGGRGAARCGSSM